jgi:hypothetical protein
MSQEEHMAATPLTRYALPASVGSTLLALGGVLHLVFGYPSLLESIAAAHLSIEAVWVAVGLNSLFFAGIAIAQVLSLSPRRIVVLMGIAAVANAVTLQWFVRHVHSAVAIFALAGFFLLLAASRLPARPTS